MNTSPVGGLKGLESKEDAEIPSEAPSAKGEEGGVEQQLHRDEEFARRAVQAANGIITGAERRARDLGVGAAEEAAAACQSLVEVSRPELRGALLAGFDNVARAASFREGESVTLLNERLVVVARECAASGELAGDRAVLDLLEARATVVKDEEVAREVERLRGRFLDVRLGSNEEHAENGRDLVKKLKAEIEADPVLSERVRRNLDQAREVVGDIKPVFCCTARGLEGIASTRRIFSFREAWLAGVYSSNTHYYDRLLGLDHIRFLSANSPATQYGENVVALHSASFLRKDCFVTPNDIAVFLSYPTTELGQTALGRGLASHDLRVGSESELRCLSVEERETLVAAIRAEGNAYRATVISGRAYLEMTVLLVAACFEEPPSLGDLLEVTHRSEREGEEEVRGALELALLDRLRGWAYCEVKFREPITENDLLFALVRSEELVADVNGMGLPAEIYEVADGEDNARVEERLRRRVTGRV